MPGAMRKEKGHFVLLRGAFITTAALLVFALACEVRSVESVLPDPQDFSQIDAAETEDLHGLGFDPIIVVDAPILIVLDGRNGFNDDLDLEVADLLIRLADTKVLTALCEAFPEICLELVLLDHGP